MTRPPFVTGDLRPVSTMGVWVSAWGGPTPGSPRDEGWQHRRVTTRTHPDRCPGVFRPWQAQDGGIVRVRIPGGRLPASALSTLVDAAERWADGGVLLTSRANLQLRGIAVQDGVVPSGLVEALRAGGLLPSDTHELVRNVVASPLTGRLGGRADLRPVVAALDGALCADAALAGLGGRFLFVLDDGRGDVLGRPLDLGLVALDDQLAQLRTGSDGWGPVVPLDGAAAALAGLARRFHEIRGTGAAVPWHVDELPDPGAVGTRGTRDARTLVSGEPVPAGTYRQSDGRRLRVVAVPDGVVTRDVADQLLADAPAELVVTPWRSVVVPDLEAS